MPFHRIILIAVSVVLTLGCATAFAETLERLTAEALRNNPELRVLEASVAAAKGGVRTARTLQNPELTIGPGFRQIEEGAKKETLFHGEFALSQLFKFPGKRALEIAIAQRNVDLVCNRVGRFSISTRRESAAYVSTTGLPRKRLRKSAGSKSNQPRHSSNPRRNELKRVMHQISKRSKARLN